MLMMYLTLSKLVNKGGADGGLSGRSSSGDPDHERRSHGRRPIPHPRVVARHAGAVLCHLGQIFLKYINVNRDQIFLLVMHFGQNAPKQACLLSLSKLCTINHQSSTVRACLGQDFFGWDFLKETGLGAYINIMGQTSVDWGQQLPECRCIFTSFDFYSYLYFICLVFFVAVNTSTITC